MKKRLLVMDIIFCALVVPGMMFLFPVRSWMQFHAGPVLGYLLWLYCVWFLCRKALGPLLLQTWREFLLVAGSLFLVGVATFMMTLLPLDLPYAGDAPGSMKMFQRAMWIMLLAVISSGIPVGMLSARNKQLSAGKKADEAKENAREAMASRKAEALAHQEDLQVKAGYRTVHVPVSAIQYIEGRNNYACFHLDHREDVVSQISLKSVMDLLPEGKFVRIHRSFIVPLWRIEKRTSTAVTLMGLRDPLPVGRAYKEELKSNK